MAAPATQQKLEQYTPELFMRRTRMKAVPLVTALPIVENADTTIDLPTSGLGQRMWIALQIQLVVAGTITGGKWVGYPYPAPWSFVKQFKLQSNQNFLMRQQSGWGLYSWLYDRLGMDVMTNSANVLYSANNRAAMQPSSSPRITPGANIAAGTYTFNVIIPVPFAFNDMCETGLAVFQSNQTKLQAVFSFGNYKTGIGATGGDNDMIAGLTGSGITVTGTATITAACDVFELPKWPNVPEEPIGKILARLWPMIGRFISVGEFTQPLQTGTNIVKLPNQNLYTAFGVEIINNGVPVAVSKISRVNFSHSTAVQNFNDDYLVNLGRAGIDRRIMPRDGCINFDLSARRFGPTRRDWIQGFDNRSVTNAQLTFDIPQTESITGVSGVRFWGESLASLIPPQG